jgi:hypothetical protein
MGAGKVRLGQFDQLIFVCADNSLAAWAVQVCLHGATFPFAFGSPIWATYLAAFICFWCFLYERTCSSE